MLLLLHPFRCSWLPPPLPWPPMPIRFKFIYPSTISLQVRSKFLETYKIGAIYWPTVQTVRAPPPFYVYNYVNCITSYILYVCSGAQHTASASACIFIEYSFKFQINFTFVPIKNQVVYTSFFSMLWSGFLAYEKHLKQKKTQTNDDGVQ